MALRPMAGEMSMQTQTTTPLRDLRTPPAMRAALQAAIANRIEITARLNPRLPAAEHAIRDQLWCIEGDLAFTADLAAQIRPAADIGRQISLIATAATALAEAYAARLAKLQEKS